MPRDGMLAASQASFDPDLFTGNAFPRGRWQWMTGANGFGRPGYPGPAPPPGDDPHHYVFRLLAADEPARLTGLPSYQDVEAAVTGHALGKARLTGTRQR